MERLIKSVKSIYERQHGFTLPEMLVVLFIIVILASLTIASYNNFKRTNQLRQAAQDVRQAIVDAQNMALAPKEVSGQIPKAYILRFQPNINGKAQYWLERDMNGDFRYSTLPLPRDEREKDYTTLSNNSNVVFHDISPNNTIGIAFKTPRAEIELSDSLGGTISASEVTITLQHRTTNETIRIKLNTTTGQTNIE